MDEIVWEDPPPAGPRNQHQRGRGPLQELVRELQAHPGKWALVREGLQDPAHSPRSRLCQLGAKTTTRQRDIDGLYNLYACWPKDAA